ncbi:DUF6615 family protein [Rhizobium mongolense]|uniref:Uncharacterized protein n=1 Tax=Rhizobium mongolense TaxID=57676 RepID=A0A7W6RWF3_9HYPH|nr:DUF6615 family protein [Rhizobium mongolense]MBB4279346.1 hypothetical protein [Rhizobium mongolense]
MGLLCRFASRFPLLAAEILERDRHKRRNFREETITDVLMAGLVPFEPLDIKTDYPVDESLTGEDMDWEFVNEHAVDGRRYLRLHIQAKRARRSNGKKSYWLYNELDHAVKPKPPKGMPKPPKAASKSRPPYGTQHKLLLDEAAKLAGCVPLYMFYHPASSLQPPSGVLPAIEGVNWMFADQIPVTPKRWPVGDRKLERWRPYFHPLRDLLCFGHDWEPIKVDGPDGLLFLIAPQPASPTPGEIAARLNEHRGLEPTVKDRPPIRAVADIPQSTLRAVRAARDGRRVAEIQRPRVIFVSGPDLSSDGDRQP